jgi:hypothetical protein
MPLPTWNVVRLPKRQLGIQCPRKDCKGKAVVTRDWLKPVDSAVSKPCTYCFKAAEIPKGFK